MFAVLFVVAWFASGGNAPDYTAADQEWTEWADDNQWKSRIGGFLILLAGFVFLHFAGTIRGVLGSAEATVRGSVQLARVAFAGALAGITGITMAIVMIAAAATEGADADRVLTSGKVVHTPMHTLGAKGSSVQGCSSPVRTRTASSSRRAQSRSKRLSGYP